MSIEPGTQTIEGVILAAGLSTRSGRWKMGLPLGDRTVLQRCVEGMLDVVDRIWVVTGWQADRVESMLQGYPKVDTVLNPGYRRGMFSSVQAGLAQVRARRVFMRDCGHARPLGSAAPRTCAGPTPSSRGEVARRARSRRKFHRQPSTRRQARARIAGACAYGRERTGTTDTRERRPFHLQRCEARGECSSKRRPARRSSAMAAPLLCRGFVGTCTTSGDGGGPTR